MGHHRHCLINWNRPEEIIPNIELYKFGLGN